MKKLLFAFAAVVLGSGAALADSAPPSVIVNPNHVVVDRTITQRDPGYSVSQNTRDSDAAPDSKVLASGPLDHTTTAAMGLSVISCVAGDFTLRRHGSDEAFAEDNGELRLGHGPFTWWNFPLFL